MKYGMVQGEVWDEKLTSHQYMTLIEKWHLQEWQALSWFHCMHCLNKSILHNFLACNLFQCYHRLYTQNQNHNESWKQSSHQKTPSKDLWHRFYAIVELNLIRKSVVQRRDFRHELGLNFYYSNMFLKDKSYPIQIRHIQLGIQNCV